MLWLLSVWLTESWSRRRRQDSRSYCRSGEVSSALKSAATSASHTLSFILSLLLHYFLLSLSLFFYVSCAFRPPFHLGQHNYSQTALLMLLCPVCLYGSNTCTQKACSVCTQRQLFTTSAQLQRLRCTQLHIARKQEHLHC